MGEQFVKEISKLLSDQSPVKSSPTKPLLPASNQAGDYLIQRNYKSLNVFDHPESLYQSSSDIEQNHLSNLSYANQRNIYSLKQPLSIQQVEKLPYSSSSSTSSAYTNIKSSEVSENGYSHTSFLESSKLQATPSLPHRMSNLSQNNLLGLTDPLKWNNIGATAAHQFSFGGLFRSSSGHNSGSSIPLYLRKGSSTLTSNASSPHACESSETNLGHSSGWSAETMRSEDLLKDGCKEEFNSAPPNLMSLEGRDVSNHRLYLHKHRLDQNGSESKTYAGVLRSTLNPDCEQN